MSGLARLLIGAWLFIARVITPLAGFGLLAYLAVRPFLPEEAATIAWREELANWPLLLLNTLIVSGTASTVSLAVAIPVAFLLFRTNLPARNALSSLLVLLACVPIFASSASILSVIGLRTFEGNAWMAGVVHGWLGIPISVLLMGWGYLGIDGSLEDAALMETSWPRVCLLFDLPLVIWSILAVVVFQAWVAIGDVAVTDLMSVRTLGEEVFIAFQLTRSAWVQSLVALPHILVFLALVWGIGRAARRTDLDVQGDHHQPPRTIDLGKGRMWWGIIAGIFLGLLTLVPIGRLAVLVGSPTAFVRTARSLRPQLVDSCILAGLTALIVVLIAMGVTGLVVSRRSRARVVRVSLLLLLGLPTPCLAIALIELLNRPGMLGQVYDSIGVTVIGQSLRWLPLAVLIAAPGWIAVTRDLRDAARIDGCGPSLLHLHVYWPVSARFLALAAVVTAILTFGELTASVLLSPPGVLPLSVRYFTLAHYGLRGEPAAICILIILVMVIPWTALLRLLGWTTK